MAHLVILAGLTMCAVSFGGRAMLKALKNSKFKHPGFTEDPRIILKYKGAFDEPMTRTEAALILGIKKI